MLQYCHNIDLTKESDENTVSRSCSCGHTPKAHSAIFEEESEASMQCACDSRLCASKLAKWFSPLLEHTALEGWFRSIGSILPKPMAFGHPEAVRHHCVNIGSAPIVLSSGMKRLHYCEWASKCLKGDKAERSLLGLFGLGFFWIWLCLGCGLPLLRRFAGGLCPFWLWLFVPQ